MERTSMNGQNGMPRREDYPVPPKPRIEDFPVVYETEPNQGTFRVSQQQFVSSDYPSWYGTNGHALYAWLVVGALALGAVITVILSKTTEHAPAASITDYFPAWLLISGACFLVLLLLSPFMKSSACKTAERNASRRCFEKAVNQCRERNDTLRSQQQRDYETAMRNWQDQKDRQDSRYEAAVRDWQLQQDAETQRKQNLEEEVNNNAVYLITSGLVDEVAEWITGLFRKALDGITPDSSVMTLQMDCMIQVQSSQIVSISYEKNGYQEAVKTLGDPEKAEEYKYNFVKQRRKNLDSWSLNTAPATSPMNS